MLDFLLRFTLPAAYDLLPVPMYSVSADASLIAIALQESNCSKRRQDGTGPARSFWQFENGGIKGVLTHRATAGHARAALVALCYSPTLTAADIRAIVEHNDVLACAFARLLLWTLPQPLALRTQPDHGWAQYIAAWRPGAPRPLDWPGNFNRAWSAVAAAHDS